MFLIALVSVCLSILTVLSVFAKCVPLLRSSVLAYGKLNAVADAPSSRLAGIVKQWTVPKHYFAHFYLVGLTFSLYCALEVAFLSFSRHMGPLLYALQQWDTAQGAQAVPWAVCRLGWAMMTLHLTRRVYETQCIERPSRGARMHVTHYLAGLGFYGAMVLGTWLEGAHALGLWTRDVPIQTSSLSPWTAVPALMLFFYASYHQHRCHCILASLRTDKSHAKNKPVYAIPQGDWFKWWIAPHYVCDMLVYASLVLLYGGRSIILWCGLCWTIVNLSVTASETKAWYLATFPAFPSNRNILIPGFW
ncbi:3-oxo-5-alpha-steroid 4-dehydrogenase-domain-containing protein [Gongronella butleri]|nr:3-oxo-5-alpha-steroid 4-dehydrogenase-domain-containing protein [Gongronella butleri]